MGNKMFSSVIVLIKSSQVLILRVQLLQLEILCPEHLVMAPSIQYAF